MYNEFSRLYDLLIDTDYNKFKDYYKKIFETLGVSPSLVLDLGCGTGTLADIMQKDGFDVIGIDNSCEMLSLAQAKNNEILYVCRDMTDFELYGSVDAVYSSLDCVNYITDSEHLHKMFCLVNNYLNSDGVFIFDIGSRYKLSEILGNNTIVYDDGKIFYTWENSFEDNLLFMTLTFFQKKGGLYERFDECQTQRAYSCEEIVSCAANAGLDCVGVYDEFSFNAPSDKSERIFFVMRRKNKCAQ